MLTQHLVNRGSGNGLVPGYTQPSYEPMMTNKHWVLWHLQERNIPDIDPWYEIEKYKYKVTAEISWAHELEVNFIQSKADLGRRPSSHKVCHRLKLENHYFFYFFSFSRPEFRK